MARTSRTTYPLAVTGVIRHDGSTVPGLVVNSPAEVRAFLVAGPRLTDGVVVESGWSDLICDTCGDGSAWCPDLQAALAGR